MKQKVNRKKNELEILEIANMDIDIRDLTK
jgi:hypothetical protein